MGEETRANPEKILITFSIQPMTQTKKWYLASEIQKELGITVDRLYYHRKNGFLKNFKQSPGSNKKGGRTYYDIEEVKQVIPTVTT